MNFIEAMKLVKEKKVKVRRPSWYADAFLHCPTHYILNNSDSVPSMSPNDILADDWCVKRKSVAISSIQPGQKFIYQTNEYVKLGGKVDHGGFYGCVPCYRADSMEYTFFTKDSVVELNDVQT